MYPHGRDFIQRALIALNNSGVILLERKQYNDAILTLRDAIDIMRIGFDHDQCGSVSSQASFPTSNSKFLEPIKLVSVKDNCMIDAQEYQCMTWVQLQQNIEDALDKCWKRTSQPASTSFKPTSFEVNEECAKCGDYGERFIRIFSHENSVHVLNRLFGIQSASCCDGKGNFEHQIHAMITIDHESDDATHTAEINIGILLYNFGIALSMLAMTYPQGCYVGRDMYLARAFHIEYSIYFFQCAEQVVETVCEKLNDGSPYPIEIEDLSNELLLLQTLVTFRQLDHQDYCEITDDGNDAFQDTTSSSASRDDTSKLVKNDSENKNYGKIKPEKTRQSYGVKFRELMDMMMETHPTLVPKIHTASSA
jgi:hypothetical protein